MLKKKIITLIFLSCALCAVLYREFYRKKIIVIGAGLAGLTAAYRLKKQGCSVDVYEARSRPGGRVFTCYFRNGYGELGGMNIHDGGLGSSLKALAEELDVPYVTYPIKRDFLYCTQDNALINSRFI